MLTYDEKVLLLKRLPSFELSYETILHKKVCGDVFMLIPKGKKQFYGLPIGRVKIFVF